MLHELPSVLRNSPTRFKIPPGCAVEGRQDPRAGWHLPDIIDSLQLLRDPSSEAIVGQIPAGKSQTVGSASSGCFIGRTKNKKQLCLTDSREEVP